METKRADQIVVGDVINGYVVTGVIVGDLTIVLFFESDPDWGLGFEHEELFTVNDII